MNNLTVCKNHHWSIDMSGDYSLDIKIFKSKAYKVSARIQTILDQKNLMRKEFAELLGKTEPEISKWMTGEHNFTLRTLSYIESILQEDIIVFKTDVEQENVLRCGASIYRTKAKSRDNTHSITWNSLNPTADIYKSSSQQSERENEPMAMAS